MYSPRAFIETDLGVLDALFQRDAFITLITQDADGQPFPSHLPVLYTREENQVRLRGHWSRANPQWKHGGQALVIVHGPHAYISPTWYTDPDQRVPTWNYAVAHLRGPLEVFHEADRLQPLVADLAAKYEQGIGSPWRFPESAPGELADLRGIVGFDIAVERIDIKCKMNQNHPAANVDGAIAGLRQQGAASVELADWMDRLRQRG